MQKLFHASIRDVLEHLSQFEIFDKFLPEGFDKTGVLKNSQTSPRNACARASFLIKMQPAFAIKDTPAQMFSCEIYEVFKNTYFVEYLQTADVVNYQLVQ